MKITITRPDDWHLHLRDGDATSAIVGHTAKQFARAIVMPNLTPPITSVSQAERYYQRIIKAVSPDDNFEPLMTLYLTEQLSAEEILLAAKSGIVKACKLYPAGATTNSEAGVRDISKIYSILEVMQQTGLVLCIHGEVINPDIDIFDREKVFIENTLSQLVEDFPNLRMVLEHITTADAAKFVESAPGTVAATITPHHLRYNRNHMLVGGIKPHLYCLPVIKRDTHRHELLRVATSGNPKFFLGTDSAPHPQSAKESACGCAGLYSAHAALPLYAEVFDALDALDKLEAFASFYGADFYGLPHNKGTIDLEKKSWTVPESYPFGEYRLVPMEAGNSIAWRVCE